MPGKHVPRHVPVKHVPVRHMLGHVLKHMPRHMLKHVPDRQVPEHVPQNRHHET